MTTKKTKYPRLMRDDPADGSRSRGWFVAEASGPATWRYHDARWKAVVELVLYKTWDLIVLAAATGVVLGATVGGFKFLSMSMMESLR